MSILPPLDWLRTFEASARHENFTQAGQELGLTQAAVSQQIRKLEGQLGVILFQRLARGVELTAEGDAYLPSVRSAIDSLARSTEDLFGSKNNQVISVACHASIASLWLVPRLQTINLAYPRVSISVAAIHRPADYEAVDADIEIRFGAEEREGRVMSHLFSEFLSPVCAPQLLEGNSEFDWLDLPFIRLVGRRSGWSEWATRAGVAIPSGPMLRFDSFMVALEAAKAGAGVLLASLPLSQTALEQKDVVRLSDVELSMNNSNWLVRKTTGSRRAVIEDICQILRSQV